MPNGLSCVASPSDMPTTANLLATYGLKPSPLFIPAIEAVLTMWPPSPWARICGRKVRTPCSTPIRLTSSTHRQLSSEMLSMPPAAATPALLQTTWTFPNAWYEAFAAHSTLTGSATSQATLRTLGPNSCRPLTASARASVSTSASITFMPACAKAAPSANPIPLAPPVTNAVLPASSRMIDCPHYLGLRQKPVVSYLHDCARTDSDFR